MKADYICAGISHRVDKETYEDQDRRGRTIRKTRIVKREPVEIELKRADDSPSRRSVCDECGIVLRLPDAELVGMFEVGNRYAITLSAKLLVAAPKPKAKSGTRIGTPVEDAPPGGKPK